MTLSAQSGRRPGSPRRSRGGGGAALHGGVVERCAGCGAGRRCARGRRAALQRGAAGRGRDQQPWNCGFSCRPARGRGRAPSVAAMCAVASSASRSMSASVAADGGLARGEPLDLRAQLEDLLQIVGGPGRPPGRPCWAPARRALGGQLAQRLAHRRAADAEGVGQLDLAEPRAGGVVAAQDEPADAVDRGVLCHALPLRIEDACNGPRPGRHKGNPGRIGWIIACRAGLQYTQPMEPNSVEVVEVGPARRAAERGRGARPPPPGCARRGAGRRGRTAGSRRSASSTRSGCRRWPTPRR